MPCLRIRKPWDRVPESQVTPESIYLNRRHFLRELGLSGMGLSGLLTGCSQGAGELVGGSGTNLGPESDTLGPYGQVPQYWAQRWRELFPAPVNLNFRVEGGVTEESLAAGYNNFYEFSLTKQRVKDLVGRFKVSPWQLEITGEVEQPGAYDVDDLIRMGQLEERLYHFRCVEAWSANIPWIGYPLSQLIEKLRPKSAAKYLRFVTLYRPEQMPGQRNEPSYPWPYYEGLTMEEAMSELALLTFGMYGHPLNKQNGAPVRLVLPWKFGFKSIKSLVRLEFTKSQPRTFWSDASGEYGFWANINPHFDHPRWSQATEIFLNTNTRIPTQMYNGYGSYVGHLYDHKDRRFFY